MTYEAQEEMWDAIAANDTGDDEAAYENRLYDEQTEKAGFENVVVQDDEKNKGTTVRPLTYSEAIDSPGFNKPTG